MKKLLFIIACFILPTVAFASVDINLKYGTSHTQVKELQEFLISKGFLTGDATGNFFTLTRKAVIAYQGSVGLPTTGYVGPMTREKINAELSQADTTSNTAEITETGKVTSPVNTKNDSLSSLQNQINALLAQLNELNAQVKTQTTTQQQIQNTVQQISANSSTPLSPPSDISIDSVSLDSVALSWTSAVQEMNVSAYKIEKCFWATGCANFSDVATVSTNRYVDNNVTGGTSYGYRIRAIDKAGNVSIYSKVVPATTQKKPDIWTLTVEPKPQGGCTSGTIDDSALFNTYPCMFFLTLNKNGLPATSSDVREILPFDLVMSNTNKLLVEDRTSHVISTVFFDRPNKEDNQVGLPLLRMSSTTTPETTVETFSIPTLGISATSPVVITRTR